MRRSVRGQLWLVLALGIATPVRIRAQSSDSSKAAAPLDGPDRPMRDTLLEHLIGHWRVSRQIRSQSTTTGADADWALNHQFVRLHYQDSSASGGSYEAMVFIGYDNAAKRYVAHWLDTFGGRWSETLGYGRVVPNGIRFVFAYPDGAFVNTLTYDARAGGWSSLMRRKTGSGSWTTFGEEHFVRVAPGSR